MTMQDPFFVVGSERSGTTMLRLMLNEHCRLFMPTESHFVAALVAQFPMDSPLTPSQTEQAVEVITQTERWQDWQQDAGALVAAVNALESPTLSDIVELAFRIPCEAGGKARWGDKTPKYVFHVPALRTLFPGARFIHLIRDGRDVCVSMLKTRWYGKSIRVLAEKWLAAVNAGESAAARYGSETCHTTLYESLVSSPHAELQRIMTFLGESFDPAMLEFYQNAGDNIHPREMAVHQKTLRKPRQSDTCRWRRELSWRQILVFEAVAGPTLRRLGYRQAFLGPLALFPWLLRQVFRFADWSLPWRSKIGLHLPRFSW